MKTQWKLAVLDENNDLLDVVKSPEDAVGLAEDYAGFGHVQTDHLQPGAIRQNPYYDLVGDLEDALVSQQRAVTPSNKKIFELTGLPVVSGEEILSITDGLTNAEDVYDILYPYFADLVSYGQNEAKAYSTPNKLVKTLIGGNEKVSKTKEGIKGAIQGLTLVPFWRNMQDELVRDAPQNKAILKKVEEDFPVDVKPKGFLKWSSSSFEKVVVYFFVSWPLKISSSRFFKGLL